MKSTTARPMTNLGTLGSITRDSGRTFFAIDEVDVEDLIDAVVDACATDFAPNIGEVTGDVTAAADEVGSGLMAEPLVTWPSFVLASYLNKDDSVDDFLIPSNPRLNIAFPV